MSSETRKQPLVPEGHSHEKDTKLLTEPIPPGSYVEFTPIAHPEGRLSQTPTSVINAFCESSNESTVWKFQSSVPFSFLQSELNELYLEIDNDVVTMTEEPNTKILIRQHPTESNIVQLESALYQGHFIAIKEDGELVPPGGISVASDERTHFSWKYAYPSTDVPTSPAIFKSKGRTLQISDGEVFLAPHSNSAKAKINLYCHSSGLFALQSHAYPSLFLSAQNKDKIIAGTIDDCSLFMLYRDKENRLAFLSNEHKDHFLVATNDKLKLSRCLFSADSGLFQVITNQT